MLVSLDDAMRRTVHALGRMRVVGAPLRLGAAAVRPLRRAILGPRLDTELRSLAGALAARPALPPSSDRPMHIAMLCSLWHEQGSGIAIWTRFLAEALVRGGHRIVVFHGAETVASERHENGVRLVGVPAARLRRWPSLPPIDPALADWQRGVCAAVLYLHQDDPLDLVSGPIWLVEPLALLATGTVPVAVSLHTTRAMLSAVGVAEDKVARALVGAERTLLGSAPIIVANTRAAAADIAATAGITFAPSRLHVVPHGLPDRASLRSEPGGGEGIRLLFLGRLERRKGIDTLLDALPDVLGGPRVTIDIAGAPQGESPEDRFRARHDGAAWLSRVHFLGPVDEAEKERLLAGADIVVLPARYESFGLVAVEAMMFGKPVISTRAGGIPEVVEDGVTGLLVPPGDASQLAAAMRRLIADPAERAAMGDAGRARYVERFTDTAMAEAWVAAIRASLANGATPPQ